MDINQALESARDGLTTHKVFGEPYQQDGVTLIPAVRLMGGGGAGNGPEGDEPQGEGGGFGMKATPAGAFVIRHGDARWQPAVDADRMISTAGIVLVMALLTRMVTVWRRSRH